MTTPSIVSINKNAVTAQAELKKLRKGDTVWIGALEGSLDPGYEKWAIFKEKPSDGQTCARIGFPVWPDPTIAGPGSLVISRTEPEEPVGTLDTITWFEGEFYPE